MQIGGKIVDFITKLGWKEQPCASIKYRKFINPVNNEIYWVGKTSIRRGRRIDVSISVTNFYKKLIKESK